MQDNCAESMHLRGRLVFTKPCFCPIGKPEAIFFFFRQHMTLSHTEELSPCICKELMWGPQTWSFQCILPVLFQEWVIKDSFHQLGRQPESRRCKKENEKVIFAAVHYRFTNFTHKNRKIITMTWFFFFKCQRLVKLLFPACLFTVLHLSALVGFLQLVRLAALIIWVSNFYIHKYKYSNELIPMS